MYPFEVPLDFVYYSDITDSYPVGVGVSFDLPDIVVLGWDGILA